jgi:hypothetical protein
VRCDSVRVGDDTVFGLLAATATAVRYGSYTSNDVEIITNNTVRLTISAAGAATFASSVSAASAILGTDPGGSALLRVGGAITATGEYVGTTVRGRGNNVSFITSRNAADDATIDLMYLNGSDQIVIGGGSYGITTSASITAASLNVGANQVVGAQGAAVADATGAGDVVAQLNALLARLRTHGLIAT